MMTSSCSIQGTLVIALFISLQAAAAVYAAEDCPVCTPPLDVSAYNSALEDIDTLTVPLFINGSFQQELRILTPEPGVPIHLDGLLFLEIVRDRIIPSLYTSLEQQLGQQGTLTLDALQASGLSASYDAAALQLLIRVPLDLISPQLLRFNTTGLPANIDPFRSARFSSFINARAALETFHDQAARQTLQMDLDGAFNIAGLAFEWTGTYQEDRAKLWQRGDVRFVYDQPEQRLRTTLGDIIYPVSGFQGSIPAGGITFSKNFALQPYRLTRPDFSGSFTLERESTVEVLVNNRHIRTLRLAPGPYDLRDFPLTSGLNDVSFRIRDAAGREELLSYPFTLDSRQLAPAESEFSYALGFPSTREAGRYHYDDREYGYSLFHRYGLSDSLTLGVNLQGNRSLQMGGLETLFATVVGVFDLNLAWSQDQYKRDGRALRLEFERNNLNTDRDRNRSWQFALQYLDPHFVRLGSSGVDNTIRYNLAARVSQRLSSRLSIGVGGNYSMRRAELGHTSVVHVQLARSFAFGMNLSLQLERRQTTAGLNENSAFLSFEFPLFANNQRLGMTGNSADSSSRYHWNYFSPQTVGGFDADISYDSRPGSTDWSGDIVYTGTRGHVGLAQNQSHESGSPTSRRSTLRADTALVFADGKFGIGRPVSNSFALLSPHPALAGQKIGVNPVGRAYEARIDRLGAAVLPVLSPYRIANARIDARDVPAGLEVGAQALTLLPTYKSGILVTIGTGATVFVIGRVEDATGLPLSLQAATISTTDRQDFTPLRTFTNRSGRFAAEGLQPGRYLLRFDGPLALTASFEIAPDSIGRKELGTLTALPTQDGQTP